jgi:hypothetical protein
MIEITLKVCLVPFTNAQYRELAKELLAYGGTEQMTFVERFNPHFQNHYSI